MGRKKKEPLTEEQIQEQKKLDEAVQFERDFKEIRERFETGRLPKNPTRIFNVGDRVQIGAWGHTTVVEVIDGGLIYKVHFDYDHLVYGKPVRTTGYSVQDWVNVHPYVSEEQDSLREDLRDKDRIDIRFLNQDIDSLLHKVYYSGVDFNPTYQRGLEWTQEQKEELIHSIFTNVDIGKFVFIKHDYSRELYFEILDGKQRLSTLCAFYEDRFTYKGKKFSELSFEDRHHFTGYPIINGEIGGEFNKLTQKHIYKIFLQLNTAGTPISKEHLEKVRKLYEDEK
jgi:hypothetical protein